MRIVVAGVAFVIEPDARLTALDRVSLSRLAAWERPTRQTADGATATFRIELREDDGLLTARRAAHPEGAPAAVDVLDGRVRVTHPHLLAEIDPAASTAWVVRPTDSRLGVDVALRTALCSVLPSRGGLPLHSAGVVIAGRGVAFFGPSGAGKSTLAAACPWPVLSDELIALFGDPPQVQGTGFWGTYEAADRTAASYPVAALVELKQGAQFSLQLLEPRAAVRRLIGVLPVPTHPEIWRQALAVLARLVDRVPAYQLTWSPAQPPWTEISARLALDGDTT